PLLLRKVADVTEQLVQGNSVRDVARSIRSSVGSAINLRNKNKEDIPPKKKGPQPKVSSRTMEVVNMQLKSGQLSSLHAAQQYVHETDGVQVHVETLRRNRRKMGTKAYVKQNRQALKLDHVKER
ncbi:hypothetical protein BGX21_007605, partial [Mortierella sp. AD011]